MTKTDYLFACAWYDMLWGPSKYGALVHRYRVNVGCDARFEKADEEVKRIFGKLTLRHNRVYVGFERLRRRARDRLGKLEWPGTRHMPEGARAWVRRHRLDAAVDAYAV